MSRDSLPQIRQHRSSGQAIVYLNRKEVYLGAYGSKEAKAEYDRVLAEWLASGRQHHAHQEPGLSVSELIVEYLRYALGYYGRDGEYKKMANALGVVRTLYGRTSAVQFGPLALKAVRARMVEKGWCRKHINRQIGRVKMFWKWATENERVPSSVYQAISTVAGLRAGHTDAKESAPVRPVPEEWVWATVEHMPKPAAAMVKLQLYTGMRPGEVCLMRGCDLDTSGKVWTYTPPQHKNQYRGHQREVAIGPKAQEIIRPFLRKNLEEYLFRPADALRELMDRRAAARITPPQQGNAAGSNRKAKPRRSPGNRYDVATYRRAIARAARVAFPPPKELARERVKSKRGEKQSRWETRKEWQTRLQAEKWAELRRWEEDHAWHPHQLRHTAATKLRKEYGIEAARIILGHKSAAVTEIYAEVDQARGREIMGRIG